MTDKFKLTEKILNSADLTPEVKNKVFSEYTRVQDYTARNPTEKTTERNLLNPIFAEFIYSAVVKESETDEAQSEDLGIITTILNFGYSWRKSEELTERIKTKFKKLWKNKPSKQIK